MTPGFAYAFPRFFIKKEIDLMNTILFPKLDIGAPVTSTPPKFDTAHKHGHVTRDGRKARFLGTIKSPLGLRHVFAIIDKDGNETVQKVFPCGAVNQPHLWDNVMHQADLFNAAAPAVEHHVYLNVYATPGTKRLYVMEHKSQLDADIGASTNRIACLELKANVPA